MSDHNAWLLLPEHFKKLLDYVYRRNTGEIWLYNYDLYVFRDKKLFKELYSEIIDKPPLDEKIRCIKILLSEERLQELKNPKSIVYKNLCNLSARRLKTLYVGPLPEKPKKTIKDLGDNPWIFYTVDGSLLSDAGNRGTVLVRHREYPFVIKNDDHAHKLTLCWQVRDKTHETAVIKERIAHLFDKWFNKNLNKFESIDPITNKEDKVEALKFINPLDDSEIEKIWNDKKTVDQKLPITTGLKVESVDFGIVTALESEADQIEKALEASYLVQRNNQPYRIGYYRAETGAIYWIAICRHVNMGSVPSALVTTDLINEFKPKYVVLLGIAAGLRKTNNENKQTNSDELQKGDVVYATAISPYEYKKYQEVKKENNTTEREVTREERTRQCSSFLIQLADMVKGKWEKDKKQKIEEDLLTENKSVNRDKLREYSKAFGGVVASGCKVIADKATLEEIAAAERQWSRKLIALEMEGEGVAEAATHKNTPFVLIKGISDYGDGSKKDDKLRNLAAQNSVDFFIDILDIFPVES